MPTSTHLAEELTLEPTDCDLSGSFSNKLRSQETQNVSEELQIAHSERKYYISFLLLHSILLQPSSLKQQTYHLSFYGGDVWVWLT